jgi:E3 ubiquitin-protein ligase TRAF7
LNPVVRNIAVFEQVGELLVHCRYGCKLSDTSDGIYKVDESGCPAVIKMCDKESHELTCDFSLVSCPNSSQCPKMLKKDLPEHLKSCRNLHCPHHKYGCQFAGDQTSISHHLKECKFEGVKDYLESLDETVVDLKSDIVKRDKIIEDLKMTVDGLSKRLEQLEKHAGTKRMEQIEDQYSRLSKDLSKTSNSFDFLMSKLTLVEQQLGLNSIELQHLFKCHGTFVGHKGPIWSLCMAEDLLFSASSDYTIKVWNLSATYEGPRTITGHDGIVLAVTARG